VANKHRATIINVLTATATLILKKRSQNIPVMHAENLLMIMLSTAGIAVKGLKMRKLKNAESQISICNPKIENLDHEL
jgi:hypothetical protein